MRVAINGFGRIGRQVFKILTEKYPKIDIVAINDLTDTKTLAHLLKYDSNYGVLTDDISATDDTLRFNKRTIKILKEREPKNLSWRALKVDLVIESTGFFSDAELAKGHITAGAKKVLITAPAKNQDVTIVLGVNESLYDPKNHNIISMASCTTNSLAPMAKVLLENFGIVKGLMTTIHSYTNDQRILDLPHDDLRRARAAAINIIPTSTGAAKAISEVIPALKDKMDGMAMRVPTTVGSITDLTIETEKEVTVEAVNAAFLKASQKEMKGIMTVSDEALVSCDIKKNTFSSIIDSTLTKVIGKNMVKTFSWYDNEWGYSTRIADLVNLINRKG